MNEYNLSLRLQYAVVVAIWSRKKSEYSLEKPLEMLCVFDYCKFLDHYKFKFLLEFIGVVVVVVVLRVFDHCKIFPSVFGILTTCLTP